MSICCRGVCTHLRIHPNTHTHTSRHINTYECMHMHAHIHKHTPTHVLNTQLRNTNCKHRGLEKGVELAVLPPTFLTRNRKWKYGSPRWPNIFLFSQLASRLHAFFRAAQRDHEKTDTGTEITHRKWATNSESERERERQIDREREESMCARVGGKTQFRPSWQTIKNMSRNTSFEKLCAWVWVYI